MSFNNYSLLCDDFYVDMHVNTELDLPQGRDTILAFCERMQREYPAMARFYRREESEYCLEEERQGELFRWVHLEPDRVGSQIINPDSLEEAYKQHNLVLELIPYMLNISHLDIESLDLTFAMDFECPSSHDEVITEALLPGSNFGSILDSAAKPIAYSPNIVLSLSRDNHTQARIAVDSKTSIFRPQRKTSNEEEPITLSLTIRQFPNGQGKFDPIASLRNQCALAEDIMTDQILMNFAKPLMDVIAQKKFS